MLNAKNNFKDEKPAEGLEDFTVEFCNNRIVEIDYLTSQLQQKKFSEIKSLSHKWKGFSSPYGFHHLEKIAHELHSKSQNEDYESCKNLIQEASEYLKQKQLLLGDQIETSPGH
ncbi:MAG: hypothetical protein MK008_09875 [Bdellovibrionales bacterium]|nr:hypothetical protein [Bdellovibrionales bacterium]